MEVWISNISRGEDWVEFFNEIMFVSLGLPTSFLNDHP